MSGSDSNAAAAPDKSATSPDATADVAAVSLDTAEIGGAARK